MKEEMCFSVRSIFKHLETQMRLKRNFKIYNFLKEHFEKTGKILIVMALILQNVKKIYLCMKQLLIWKF